MFEGSPRRVSHEHRRDARSLVRGREIAIAASALQKKHCSWEVVPNSTPASPQVHHISQRWVSCSHAMWLRLDGDRAACRNVLSTCSKSKFRVSRCFGGWFGGVYVCCTRRCLLSPSFIFVSSISDLMLTCGVSATCGLATRHEKTKMFASQEERA